MASQAARGGAAGSILRKSKWAAHCGWSDCSKSKWLQHIESHQGLIRPYTDTAMCTQWPFKSISSTVVVHCAVVWPRSHAGPIVT